MRLRQWVQHLVIYGFGVILMNVLPTLLIPIYTHCITPSEYGVLELLNRSQEILLLILSLGLRSALATFYQMMDDQPDRQKGVYSTALQFLSAFGLLAILGMLAGAGEFSRILFRTSEYGGVVLLMLIATYFEMLFQAAVLYLQSKLRSGLYVGVFVARSALAVALNLVLVYWLRWGLTGILWATLLHTMVFAVALLILTLRSTWQKMDLHVLGEMLRFGAPLAVGGIAMFVLNNGDRYMLNAYAGRAEVGIYGLGYKIGSLSMMLVLTPFLKVWSATMVNIARRADGPQQLGRIATYLLAASTFSTLGLSLMGPFLLRFLATQSYWDAYRVVPLVGAAYVFYSWTIVMDASFYISKNTLPKLYNVTLACVVVLGLYQYLIPRFGMMGAAWATLGGFVSFAAITALLAQRLYYIEYQFLRIGRLFALAFALYGCGALVPLSPLLLGVTTRIVIILAFPTILWLTGFWTDTERQALHGYWQALRLRYLSKAQA